MVPVLIKGGQSSVDNKVNKRFPDLIRKILFGPKYAKIKLLISQHRFALSQHRFCLAPRVLGTNSDPVVRFVEIDILSVWV